MDEKCKIDDLAVFGGPPAFRSPLHVGRPNIGNRVRLIDRINDILDCRWLTNGGKYVQAFEREIQEITGVRHCIAVCNGTMGLALAAKALGFSGEVIVPSFTFIATAHVMQWHGIKPVFCDVDPTTHNLDPEKLVSCINQDTSGILGVHVWGRPCAIERLTEIAQQFSMPLIFDAAHGFGCSYGGQTFGNFGNAEVFSFHATKYVNSFEGGAITTNDDELAQKIRTMCDFGFVGVDRVISLGINAKMNEVSAAMGITSLESRDDFVLKNKRNYDRYHEVFDGIPGISMCEYDEANNSNYQYIVVEVDAQAAGLDRDMLVEILQAENVLARRYFYPGCHRMEPYRTLYPHAGESLPETERLVSRVMCLPTGTTVGSGDIDTIAGIIHLALSKAQEIDARR
jgi:dTDP-4-amino-4,6-dideoxygalactose transaminase